MIFLHVCKFFYLNRTNNWSHECPKNILCYIGKNIYEYLFVGDITFISTNKFYTPQMNSQVLVFPV